MTVVSNTSPLTNLAAIGQFELLHQLHKQVHIAQAVWDELSAGGKHWPGRSEVGDASWIERHIVANEALVTALQYDLDRGEAESIALALELDADLVLLDEREGRHIAQRMGLRVVGVVGLLLQAKSGGLVTQIRPLLDDLRQIAGFYLSQTLYEHVLELAGESDP